MQPELVTRERLDRQRIVVELAVRELGDGKVIDPDGHPRFDRIVLVHEQRVEKLVMACDAVNFAQREVLMVEGVVVRGLQLIEQAGDGGARGQVGADRHGVDQQADHRFGVAGIELTEPGPRGTERDVVPARQRRQQHRPRGLQHGADGGLTRAGQV
ncbi:Uncharacterised protein [Mycobacteroides abscessus subsp. abscessus]|nr:Uncharacterised protein [Mycobacteroides abscessus subsp. abscessus]